MKTILITGVTGYIGGSIAVQLLKRNYKVLGLIRNETDKSKIEKLGITPIIGSIDNIDIIEKTIEKVDAVINTADADNAYFVATSLEKMKGTNKTFIHTSGSSIVANRDEGNLSTFVYNEDIPIKASLEKLGRISINKSVISYSMENVRTIVIVPTMIYGKGLGVKKDSIQVPKMIELAKFKKIGTHIGKGKNVWSNVHIEDLVELYILALENADSGSIFYAENGSASYEEIALAINRSLGFGKETKSMNLDEAIGLWGTEGAHFAFGGNSRVTSRKAKALLGWNPQHTSILGYIESQYGTYS